MIASKPLNFYFQHFSKFLIQSCFLKIRQRVRPDLLLIFSQVLCKQVLREQKTRKVSSFFYASDASAKTVQRHFNMDLRKWSKEKKLYSEKVKRSQRKKRNFHVKQKHVEDRMLTKFPNINSRCFSGKTSHCKKHSFLTALLNKWSTLFRFDLFFLFSIK
jgi:hypothetical protein